MPPQAAPRAAFGYGRGKPLPASGPPPPGPLRKRRAPCTRQVLQSKLFVVLRTAIAPCVHGALRLRLGAVMPFRQGLPPPASAAPPVMPFRQGSRPHLAVVPPSCLRQGYRPPLSRVPPGAPGGAP